MLQKKVPPHPTKERSVQGLFLALVCILLLGCFYAVYKTFSGL